MAEQPPLHGLDEHESLKPILERIAMALEDRIFATGGWAGRRIFRLTAHSKHRNP